MVTSLETVGSIVLVSIKNEFGRAAAKRPFSVHDIKIYRHDVMMTRMTCRTWCVHGLYMRWRWKHRHNKICLKYFRKFILFYTLTLAATSFGVAAKSTIPPWPLLFSLTFSTTWQLWSTSTNETRVRMWHLVIQIVYDESMTTFREVGSHKSSHITQSNESDNGLIGSEFPQDLRLKWRIYNV